MSELISLIVPCSNEEQSLPYFWKEVTAVMEKMDYLDFEVIFVNDGSRDGTLELLRKLAKEDKRAKYLSFSRNFGKEAAMYAGLQHAAGDYAAVMDAVDAQPDTGSPKSSLRTTMNTVEHSASRHMKKPITEASVSGTVVKATMPSML